MANIFNFQHYRDYLNTTLFPKGLYQQDSLNLRKLTQKLGYKSPSLLSMVLSGARHPSRDMIEKLGEELELGRNELKYFHLLVELEKKKDKDKDISSVLARIEEHFEHSQEMNVKKISLADFESIAQWYYLVVKQLVDSDGFVEDTQWIVEKLRGKVRPHHVKKAIEHLLAIGAVKRDESGKLKKCFTVQSPNEVPSSAIRQHHIGMIERAKEAVEEQCVEQRSLQSLTLKFDLNELSEAKKDIVKFVDDFNEKYFKVNSDDIYQLNVQLFSHTKSSDELTGRHKGELIQ